MDFFCPYRQNVWLFFFLLDNSVDFTMLCLDVKSLFTQAPITNVLDFLERKANAGPFTSFIPFNHFRRLIEICANNCLIRYWLTWLQSTEKHWTVVRRVGYDNK